jgi:peptidylprolyl isomerase
MKKFLLVFLCLVGFLSAGDKKVIFETNMGKITFILYPQIAPKAVENFVTHAQNGYYDGVIFHRVIKNFMIQSGDPTGSGRGGESIWKKDFEDEFKPGIVFDRAGILAMANRGRNTNGSQFFITTKPTPWLNGRHTIFGEVEEGYKVIEEIENTKTDSRDKPIKEIKILRAYLQE